MRAHVLRARAPGLSRRQPCGVRPTVAGHAPSEITAAVHTTTLSITTTVPPVGMEWLDETHRRVGAICNRSTWLEYQLEIAYMELADPDDLSATQASGTRRSSR